MLGWKPSVPQAPDQTAAGETASAGNGTTGLELARGWLGRYAPAQLHKANLRDPADGLRLAAGVLGWLGGKTPPSAGSAQQVPGSVVGRTDRYLLQAFPRVSPGAAPLRWITTGDGAQKPESNMRILQVNVSYAPAWGHGGAPPGLFQLCQET